MFERYCSSLNELDGFRIMASFGVKVIRSVFGMAEHVAPRLVGRAAFELFCRTPARTSLSESEKRAIARAAPFMREARHHRVRTRAGCISVHEFRPEAGSMRAGTVLVIHGWRSRTEYMRALIETCRAAGHRVLSVDLPGHGASPGRRLTMVSAVDAAESVAEWFGPFSAVIGHSFGGAVAANAVAGSIRGIPPVAAFRLVLLAAPSSLPAIFDAFGNLLHLGPRTRAAVARQVERIAGRPLDEFTGTRQLAGTPLPTLVVHAPEDREVPAGHAELFASAGSHVRLHWTPGLGHRRILADRGVLDEVLAFIAPVRVH
jgi:pimeloyl-ACP methyl ester carboxylesterase